MNGYLEKRTRALLKQEWHRRHFVLSGSTLSWSAGPGEPKKDEVSLLGAVVEPADERKLKGKAHAFTVVVNSTTLLLAAPDALSAASWRSAIQQCSGGAGKAAIPRSSLPASVGFSGGSGGSPLSSLSPVPSSSDAKQPDVRLPDRVTLEGFPSVREELRLVCGGVPLEALSVQWVRVPPASAATALDTTVDVAVACPGAKHIPSATTDTYTVTQEDAGFRLGCGVRATAVTGSRWAISDAVVGAPSTSPAVPLTLLPHQHSKYCDRRLRVCSAAGRYRQGAVIQAAPPSGVSLSEGQLVWYRSGPVRYNGDPARPVGAGPAAPPDASGGTRSAGGGGEVAHRGAVVPPAPWGSNLAHSRAAGASSGGAAAPLSASSAAAGATASDPLALHVSQAWGPGPGPLTRVIPRPVSHLPPEPPDHAPAVGLSELKATLRDIAAPWPPPPGNSLSCASGGPSSLTSYPLFADDTDRVIAALWIPTAAGQQPPAAPEVLYPTDPAVAPPQQQAPQCGYRLPLSAVLSRCVGPVEAAPPRAREIWVEGQCVVGSLLQGHYFYVGGAEGPTLVSWVAVGDDGEQLELKPPAPLPAASLAAYRAMGHRESGAGVAAPPLEDSHPAALRLRPEHVGHLIKFKVKPVRADLDEGHTESSRPSQEVRAA